MGANILQTERNQLVLAIYGEGLSASQVAARMLKDHGIQLSRNAVLGIVHRHGSPDLARQATARRSYPSFPLGDRVKKNIPHKPEIIVTEPEPIGPPDQFPERKTCRYTKDDVAIPGWKMCGHDVTKSIHSHDGKRAVPEDHPWCEWHEEHVIYNKSKPDEPQSQKAPLSNKPRWDAIAA